MLSLSLFLSGCGQNSAVTANAPANSPAGSGSTVADASGNFSFTGLASGSYILTASSQSATFLPASLQVILNNADVSGANFTATATAIPSFVHRETPLRVLGG